MLQVVWCLALVPQLPMLVEGLAQPLDAWRAMPRLEAILTGYPVAVDLRALSEQDGEALKDIVNVARRLNGADRGVLQVFDRRLGGLRIVAQHGFRTPFLDYFKLVTGTESTCGEAMMRNQVVVVDDVLNSPIFDRPTRRVMKTAGALSVQSTPMVTASGLLVGVLSTHFDRPWAPTYGEQYLVQALASVVADWVRPNAR